MGIIAGRENNPVTYRLIRKIQNAYLYDSGH